jgi:hypothetical protein
MATELLYRDASCNTASISYPTSVTITDGAMSGSLPYSHTLGNSDSFSFTPPSISSPACETGAWNYQVIWSSSPGNDSFSVKSNLSVVVDPTSSQIKVRTI